MDHAAVPVTVRWEIGYLIFFATFLWTETDPAHPGEHVQLSVTHHCHSREHLDRHGPSYLAENPGRRCHRGGCHPGQQEPCGKQAFVV